MTWPALFGLDVLFKIIDWEQIHRYDRVKAKNAVKESMCFHRLYWFDLIPTYVNQGGRASPHFGYFFYMLIFLFLNNPSHCISPVEKMSGKAERI